MLPCWREGRARTGGAPQYQGLGLWVSSEIVRRHGGTIQVKGRAHPPFTGTVFSVFLPSHASWTPAPHSGEVNDYQHETVQFLACRKS